MKENLKKTESTPELLDIGLIGLSVMGRSLALNMADHGFLVACYNRSSVCPNWFPPFEGPERSC